MAYCSGGLESSSLTPGDQTRNASRRVTWIDMVLFGIGKWEIASSKAGTANSWQRPGSDSTENASR